MTTKLETISGIRARIYHLPNRPPFMTGSDLADAYGTTTKRVNEAVKRNPNRFPERYAFHLTIAEEEQRWSQNAATAQGKRTDLEPLVFTHGGANMLSRVLRSEIAVEMAVAINDAFTLMEAETLAELNFLLQKVSADARFRKPVRSRIVEAVNEGWTFDMLKETVTLSQPKLVQAIKDCIGLGLIKAAPEGTPLDLASSALDHRQMAMFANG